MTDRWQAMQDDIGDFTEKIFGKSTLESKMAHLEEEIGEILAEPNDHTEWADCLILFLDAARLTGLNIDDLYNAVKEKMKINKNRKWGVPDEDGVVHHIK